MNYSMIERTIVDYYGTVDTYIPVRTFYHRDHEHTATVQYDIHTEDQTIQYPNYVLTTNY